MQSITIIAERTLAIIAITTTIMQGFITMVTTTIITGIQAEEVELARRLE